MDRTLALTGTLLLATAALIGCSREGSAPGAGPTSTPAARAAAPTAAASAAAVEELYVDVEAEPDEGAPPLTVKFTTEIEDATPPITYRWEFGDGSAPGADASPTHVFEKEGEYTVTVSVKDAKGVTGTEEVDVFVEAQ